MSEFQIKITEYLLKIIEIQIKLDVDPQRDDDASPMSSYRCMLRHTWMISALQHKSKYKSNSISNFFEKKKIKFFDSHVVVLVKTFPLTYQLLTLDWYWRSQGDFFLAIRKLGVWIEFNFVNFELFEKFSHLGYGFPCCSTREDHSIDVSITNVGLILTKLRWFQLFVKRQISNFKLFWTKILIFGFPWCSTR